MTSVLFVGAFALVTTGLGWLFVEKCDRSRLLTSLERLGVSFTFGCFILYIGVFIIAPFRLDFISISSLLGICAAVSFLGLRKIPWQRVLNSLRSELNELTTDKWLAFLWLAVITIAGSSLIQGLAPPNDYDGLAYHLAFPRLDVEKGQAVLALKTGWPATFFPALGSHLTRASLVIADAGAAQMIHGLFGILGGISAATLALRLGYGKQVALAAAILFLSIRMVIWQMGSVETDVPVGALATMSMVIYLVTRENKSIGLEIIFGIMIACTILMKYHGLATTLALVPLILFDLLTRRKSFSLFVVGPTVALAAIMPHLIRDYMFTGNPFFPLMIDFFNPGIKNMLGNLNSAFGTGRGLGDLLVTPWNIFILPTHYFDGMVIGAPYLLALCPLVLLEPKDLRKWGAPLLYIILYFIIWFWFLSQQVRFLAPIMPSLAALAAAGTAIYWKKICNITLLKAAFVTLVGILAVNQSMFIGVFSMIRLPAAIGLMSPAVYHNKTPTMGGAYYSTCKYIENNLKEGERYFIFAPYISFYCPQAFASLTYFEDEEGWWMKSKPPPQMSTKEFLRRLNETKFAYFLVQHQTESRRRIASRAIVQNIDRSNVRFGNYLGQAFNQLTPLVKDHFSAVYDGTQVLEILNNRANSQ